MKRLIVSFIGNMDLSCFGLGTGREIPREGDMSPIQRLLMHVASEGGDPQDTTLMLFDDDRSRSSSRRDYCEMLEQRLPELGLRGMSIVRHAVQLPDGPTDLNALYENVWSAIRTSGPDAADEVFFHLSSGTWAMQSTLLLASNCLPLNAVRLFETSAQQGVTEVRVPYVLAARELRHRNSGGRPARLSASGRKSLLPGTVVDDVMVQAAYATLHKAASNVRPQTLLIEGPTGSGKWHAARQFGRWRGAPAVEWLSSSGMPGDVPNGATLLLWRLDAWSQSALSELSSWRVSRPDVAVAGTWRTDMPAAAPLHEVASVGLRGAMHVQLPSISARSDIVALGMSVAEQSGLWTAKIKERLQYELLTDMYAANLHDLKQVLTTAAMGSSAKGRHPDERGFVRAVEIADAAEAQALLREVFDTLSGLRFGKGRPDLKEVLDTTQLLVVRMAMSGGRTQEQAADLLGYAQTGISELLRKKIDLRWWQTHLRTAVDTTD